MFKFLVTNDVNNIDNIYVSHFSIDKGHYLAKSLVKLKHTVYFLTKNDNYEREGLKYVSADNVTDAFLKEMDYILISREGTFVHIIKNVPSIKTFLQKRIEERIKPKIIVRSDYPLWYHDKEIRRSISELFSINMSTNSIHRWIIKHIDYIGAQNSDFKNLAIWSRIPPNHLIVSSMGIPNYEIDYEKLANPYCVNHSYCVEKSAAMITNRALLPKYYIDNPNKKNDFNKNKYIIIYTGRVKVDKGKIFYNMRNIMNKLGDEYELHIFPGTFLIPSDKEPISCSSKNTNNLGLLRDTIFAESKNVIIHYPYEHKDKYRYLHFANCGIDFSDIRPRNGKAFADHAKILEYCEVGLPIICEENIHNTDLIKRGNNGYILPYMASDDEYACAIKKVIHEMKVDRAFCRKITLENENWDRKAKEYCEQLVARIPQKEN